MNPGAGGRHARRSLGELVSWRIGFARAIPRALNIASLTIPANLRSSTGSADRNSGRRIGQDVAKLAYLFRILTQPILDQPMHSSLWKRSVWSPFAGHPLHQQPDPLVDVADTP